MKQIKLSRGMFALVDDADYEWLNQWKWFAQKGNTTYYAVSHQGSKTVRMHRLILGLTDPKIEGDHRNHNGLDNQRLNLRASTKKQNRYNSRNDKNSLSKFRGVRLTLRKWKNRQYRYWHSRIMKDGISYHLGIFKTEEEAAHVYDNKAKELFGEFANLNFP